MSHFRFTEVLHRAGLVLAYSLMPRWMLDRPFGLPLLVSVPSPDPVTPGRVLAYGLGGSLTHWVGWKMHWGEGVCEVSG